MVIDKTAHHHEKGLEPVHEVIHQKLFDRVDVQWLRLYSLEHIIAGDIVEVVFAQVIGYIFLLLLVVEFGHNLALLLGFVESLVIVFGSKGGFLDRVGSIGFVAHAQFLESDVLFLGGLE